MLQKKYIQCNFYLSYSKLIGKCRLYRYFKAAFLLYACKTPKHNILLISFIDKVQNVPVWLFPTIERNYLLQCFCLIIFNLFSLKPNVDISKFFTYKLLKCIRVFVTHSNFHKLAATLTAYAIRNQIIYALRVQKKRIGKSMTVYKACIVCETFERKYC